MLRNFEFRFARSLATRQGFRHGLIFVVYLIAFLVLDVRAHSVQVFPGIVAWYPSEGLNLAMLITFGMPFLPAVTLASLLSSLFLFKISLPPFVLLGWAVFLSLTYGSAVWLLKERLHLDLQLRRPRDLFWLVAVTSLVSGFLAAISVLGLVAGGVVPEERLLWSVAQWWIGEMIGTLVVAPVLLIHLLPRVKRFSQAEPFQKISFAFPSRLVLAQLLSIFVALYIGFNLHWGNDFHLYFLIGLPLLWIAIEHGLPATTLSAFFVNFATVRLAEWHDFDFAELGQLQSMLLVVTLASLFIGVIVSENKRAIGPAHTRVVWRTKKVVNELIIIAIVSVMAWLTESTFDLYAAISDWERRSNVRGVGETFVTITVLGIAAAVFSYRRWRETWIEMKGREKAQAELQSLYRELEVHVQARTIDLSKANHRLQAEIVERQQAESELLRSEKRFRALIENSADAIALLDANGMLVYDSPAAPGMLGYAPDEKLQEDMFSLVHSDDVIGLLPLFQEVVKTPGMRSFNTFRLQHKDGSWRWVESLVTNLLDEPSVKAVVANYRDITERKQAEENIQARTEELSTLYELSRTLAAASSLDEVLDVVNRQIVESVHATFSRIALLERNELITRSVYPRRVLDHDLLLGARVPLQALPNWEQILKQDEPIVLRELETQMCQEDRSAFLLDTVHGLYLIPLHVHDFPEGSIRTLGLLMIGEARNEDREPFTPEKQRLARSIGEQAAIAIDKARLVDRLERTNADLALAYDATIAGWSAALDLRDKETEGHTLRVTEMTLKLAICMGFQVEDLIHLRRGALLHDIGKMGVPDNILLKPGKLTEAEWQIMRLHPTYAYQMLEPITYLGPSLDIPYCHHEKWDGTGYPRRLAGEKIPLAARIFSIIDVYDALTSDRPYRAAWSDERTLEHIQRLSGTHFDPQVVDAFLKLMKEGLSYNPVTPVRTIAKHL